ncbi:MAG: anthranilate phosphoribosyltransferase [Bdellovibrionota bacterium]
MPPFPPLLGKVTRDEDLSETEMTDFLDAVAGQTLSPAQIGGMLAALSAKGPSSHEIAAAVKFLRRHLIPVKTKRKDLLDTCGTGGDASGTFNISTVVAFVAAGAGAAVAKHGNRAASSKSGSADVLEVLGIKIDLPPEKVAACIDEVGIGFLYAPAFHPVMKHVGAVRKELGIKTIFNLAGPLSNPAGAKRQLIGVYDRRLVGVAAQALHELGAERAMVVCGHDGLDEITLTTQTEVAELKNGAVEKKTFDPESLGLLYCEPKSLLGGTPQENAQIAIDILEAKKMTPKRSIVEINAAAALYVAGIGKDLSESLRLAQGSIDTGAAWGKLEKLREFTNS